MSFINDNFILKDIFNCRNIVPINKGDKADILNDPKGIIIGNIRMGFGHYRIAMAMASAVNALVYHPYWFDLSNFKDSLATKEWRYVWIVMSLSVPVILDWSQY